MDVVVAERVAPAAHFPPDGLQSECPVGAVPQHPIAVIALRPDRSAGAMGGRPSRPETPHAAGIGPGGCVPTEVWRHSRLMTVVLGIVRRLAATGEQMPSNPRLAEIAGARYRSSVRKSLQRMEKAGLIQIEIKEEMRRVHIVKTSARTGWGPYPLGHAPYSVTPRPPPGGLCPPKASPQMDGIVRPGRVVIDALNLRPTGACEFALWPDHMRPSEWARQGNRLFCGEPSIARKSWCCAHTPAIRG